MLRPMSRRFPRRRSSRRRARSPISPAILMHVEEDRKLNPGGVLPTVLAVPALLAMGFVGLRAVRRLT